MSYKFQLLFVYSDTVDQTIKFELILRLFRIRAIQSTILTAKSSSEKNISNIGAQSPLSNTSSQMNSTGARSGIINDINTRETNIGTTGTAGSNHNVMRSKNLPNTKLGKENNGLFPNNSVVSSNGLANLNYNPEKSHHSQKQVMKPCRLKVIFYY